MFARYQSRSPVKFPFSVTYSTPCRSQWPRGIKRGPPATRLLKLRVWTPLGARKSVSCECCVLPSKGFCDGPIFSPGSYTECSVRSRNFKNVVALARFQLLCQSKITPCSIFWHNYRHKCRRTYLAPNSIVVTWYKLIAGIRTHGT